MSTRFFATSVGKLVERVQGGDLSLKFPLLCALKVRFPSFVILPFLLLENSSGSAIRSASP